MTVATGNEVQTVTVAGASSGTFTLTYAAEVTDALAFDAAANTVQTALRALSTVGANNVTVTGDAGGPYTVTFVGALRDTNVAELTAQDVDLDAGTVEVETTSAGNPPVTEIAYCDISANGTVANLEVLVGQTPPAGALLVDKDGS